jgi:uncharacterized membrane protein
LQVLPAATASAIEDTRSDYEKVADMLGKSLYFLAWPTAKYQRANFGSVTAAANGADVVFRLYGKSAFDDGELWTDVVLQIRNGEVSDLKWGRNNALLMAPGGTMKAVGAALKDLNRELARNQGYRFIFTNGCQHPVRLAISYEGVDGRWHTTGWWKFEAGQSAPLAAEGQIVRTNSAVWYYYAQTTDGSDLSWRGDYPVSLDGGDLPMAKLEDNRGDSEWSTTCD